jgi:hypothetical protein
LRCIGNFCSRPCYFLFLFAQHVPLFFFRHQPQSLMFPCSCPFYSTSTPIDSTLQLCCTTRHVTTVLAACAAHTMT